MNITVKYGIDQINKHTTNDAITVSEVVNDYEIKASLGFGDNVRALVNGVEQPPHAQVPDGATLVIETRANSKAVREFDLDLIEV